VLSNTFFVHRSEVFSGTGVEDTLFACLTDVLSGAGLLRIRYVRGNALV
jgi:hypothetical protein